jgi:hypothetical protein
MASGEIQKRFDGDFVINTVKLATENYDVGPTVDGNAEPEDLGVELNVPISLSIPGPITLRRVAPRGNIPYIVSNGGDPLNIPTDNS